MLCIGIYTCLVITGNASITLDSMPIAGTQSSFSFFTFTWGFDQVRTLIV